jgi:hypothetical protein
MTDDVFLSVIIVILNTNSFLIGYLLGRTRNNGVISSNTQSFFTRSQDKKLQNNLSIDDKKFVTDIKTDGLERKYNTLGDIKQTEDNISDSVNKLKNLKR